MGLLHYWKFNGNLHDSVIVLDDVYQYARDKNGKLLPKPEMFPDGSLNWNGTKHSGLTLLGDGVFMFVEVRLPCFGWLPCPSFMPADDCLSSFYAWTLLSCASTR